ncbi:type II toxin-antitoxin system HicA family toxin [Paramicrobacterium sp. CJ85]|uniref:type II toxin-antitoxin system HicA family toxin n=1 Tax=Paramicrobacterium sp. CJ85 TaxID=3445355 RepID=UPI003F63061A
MYRRGYALTVKEAKRNDVERFLRTQGYSVLSEKGGHTKWGKPGARPIPLPRHNKISPGVLRTIEKTVGFVPEEWK